MGANATPEARIVLLKDMDERGFVFYTNYESAKAQAMAATPRVSLLFFWGELERQVRITGSIEKVSREESDAYFQLRPRESRIGAWVSKQSSVIESRAALEQRFAELTREFEGKDIPLPPFWGGYRVQPETIEFWQGRVGRLHDRLLYERKGAKWAISRLSP
jgi:pyridoxamine 5'-phosphate oxidase